MMENTLVCTSPPVIKEGSPRKHLILMSVGCIGILVLVFFIYRFIKNMNRRFSKLEEVISRLIEKNNQMHHQIIQHSPPPVVHNRSSQPFHPPPPPPPPSPTPPPIDLDAELQAELQELNIPKPVAPPVLVQEPPVPVEPAVVKEEDVPEGRVDA